MNLFLKKINKLNKGFTLVETLVAISIFSISIVALMSILGGGISDTNYAKQKIIATYLAQEGIEYVRNMRDNYVLYDPINSQTGWNKFKVDIDSITIPKININFYPITGSDFANFNRTIKIDPVSLDEVKVSSTVSWNQKSGSVSITFSEDLFNWIE